MVIDGYMVPMREARVVTESELAEMFSNLAQVVKSCTEMMNALVLRQLDSQTGLVDRIGDVLLRELPKLRDFGPFCANMSRSVQFIVEKRKVSQPFAEKLVECQRHEYFRNLDLNSYLLKPMQRITKVPLLIKGILKYTTAEHADHQDLVQAEAVSQEILLFINTQCGVSDERRKLERMQGKLNFDLT